MHKYATQTQSYQDHYSGQASRSDALEYHDEESDHEDYDDETDADRLLNVIEKMTQPDGEPTKEKLKYLINEYRTRNQNNSDEDKDDDYDSSDEDKDDDYDDYDSSDEDTEDEEVNNETDKSDNEDEDKN